MGKSPLGEWDQRAQDRDAAVMLFMFRVRRFIRAVVLMVLGLGLLGGVLAYSYVLIGPPDNPVRALATRYGLVPQPAASGRAVAFNASAAHQAYDRGDLEDLARAEEYIDKAHTLAPASGTIAADRALILAAHAGVLARWQLDLAGQAADLKNKDKAQQLRAQSDEKKAESAKQLDLARRALEEAQRAAPAAFETARAQAEIDRLAGETARAKEALSKAHAVHHEDDPWLLAVEAQLANARPSDRLAHAVDIAPEFLIGRVLLARALVAQHSTDAAEKQLNLVLEKAPVHTEALRVMDQVKELKGQAPPEAPAAAISVVTPAPDPANPPAKPKPAPKSKHGRYHKK
jgi:hypothetical protein